MKKHTVLWTGSWLATILLSLMLAFAACSPPNSVCTDGNCDQSCKAGEVCNKACPKGGCKQDCPTGSTCNFTCTGGKCEQTCADDVVSCQVTCTGGNCDQTCGAKGLCTCAPGNCD